MQQTLSRLLLSLGLLVGCSAPAFATTVYTIDVPNAALSGCCTGPYATATVNLIDATHASVTFDSLINGGNWYLMGSNGAADVNVNATSFSIGGITAFGPSNPGFSAPSCSDDGSKNISSFGVMNQTVKCFDGFTNAADKISFVLTDLSGTWASDAVVLAANASGFFAAVHAFPCPVTSGLPSTCSSTATVIATGFAGNSSGGGPPVLIPEPQSLVLLGLGLVVLALMRRRQVS